MRAARKDAKYKAVPTHVDGIRFASKAEAQRYSELKILEKAGTLSALRLQPRYELVVSGVKIGTYVGDFCYWDGHESCTVVEDVKGVRTPVYQLKKKLMKALYGIEIREVTRNARPGRRR